MNSATLYNSVLNSNSTYPNIDVEDEIAIVFVGNTTGGTLEMTWQNNYTDIIDPSSRIIDFVVTKRTRESNSRFYSINALRKIWDNPEEDAAWNQL